MSLPASEQRALDRIEEALHAGDPRLRSLFMIFTRLTRHEAIPSTEQVSAQTVEFPAPDDRHSDRAGCDTERADTRLTGPRPECVRDPGAPATVSHRAS